MLSIQEIQDRLQEIRGQIVDAAGKSGRRPEDVRLIAVTKTHPVEVVQGLVDSGVVDIGENRVQELAAKAPLVKGTISWHMVGHLQRNKVKKALEYVDWIQSVDSDRLADEIQKYATAAQKKVKVLVEVNTSRDASKTGCPIPEAVTLCEKVAAAGAMEFCGLMTIGPLSGGEAETRASFVLLRELGEKCRHLSPRIELSMGMSNDFSWAIEEGSTMVRIGTKLLGGRP